MRLILITEGSAADFAEGDRLVHAMRRFFSPPAITGFDADSSPLKICGRPKTPARETWVNETRRDPATTSSHTMAAPPSAVSVSCGCPGVDPASAGSLARGENVLPSREVA
jgi:hypothetical protein